MRGLFCARKLVRRRTQHQRARAQKGHISGMPYTSATKPISYIASGCNFRQRPPGTVGTSAFGIRKFVVVFSLGEDSVACFLSLIDQGVPLGKIKLHHYLVDGNESSEPLGWPVTADYCKKFADAFGVRLSFSRKERGPEREMLRNHAPTAPMHFYSRAGQKMQVGGAGP